MTLSSAHDAKPATASKDSGGSASSAVGDELASAWNATVTSDPPASAAAAALASSSFLNDAITADMGSSPSGITAKPHGRRATALESCPSITGRRVAPSTDAYATVDSQGLVLLSWRIHSPLCSPAGDLAACHSSERVA